MRTRDLIFTLALSVCACAVLAPAAPAVAQTAAQRAQSRQVSQSLATRNAAERYVEAGVGTTALREAISENLKLQENNTRLSRDLRRTEGERRAAASRAADAEAEVARLNREIEAMGVVEAGLRMQIDVFAEQAAAIADTDDPEKLAALELFAAGLEEEAFPVLEEIALARIEANNRRIEAENARRDAVVAELNRDSAAQWRELAFLAEQMRLGGLKRVDDVIPLWERAQAADPDFYWGWIELARLYRMVGRTTDAGEVALRAEQATLNIRDRSVALTEIGDSRLMAGDLIGAREAYDESLALVRRALVEDPYLLEPSDLGVALGRAASIRRNLGDLTGAIDLGVENVAVRRALVAQAPDDPLAQRGLGAALDELATIVLEAGDVSLAGALYRESLDIRRNIVARNPDDPDAARRLAMTLAGIGQVQFAEADFFGAEASFEEATRLFRSLAALDTGNGEAQHDLSVALQREGEFRSALGQHQLAIALTDEAVAVRRLQAQVDPTFGEAEVDLAKALWNAADVRVTAREYAASVTYYQEAAVIYRGVVRLPGYEEVGGRALAALVFKLALVHRRMGAADLALPLEQESASIYRALLAENPGSVTIQREYWFVLPRECDRDRSACLEFRDLTRSLAAMGALTAEAVAAAHRMLKELEIEP